nr:MAG TPA: hypothetical protein [Bacteriophage sp.]
MAYIKNTAFESRVSNDKRNDLANVTGRFQTDGADDVCSAGFLCVRGENLPCEGYSAQNLKNENAWYMEKATADAKISTVIYACNTYDWNLIVDPVTGAEYAVGVNTLGLPVPAGRDGTFTKIDFTGDRRYRFGIGNVEGTIGTNKYMTIADGMLVPTSEIPAANGSIYFELDGQGNFTQGTRSSFGYVDVIAKHVVA